MSNISWKFLKDGDTIDVIAPSSPPDHPTANIQAINDYFEKNTKLKLNIPDDIIQPTSPLNEANSIEKRVQFIKQALESDSKAIWAIIGEGWGCELLDVLQKELNYSKAKPKPIIGYSDVTALHVFFNQYWQWPTIHGVVLGSNGDINNQESFNKTHINTMLDVLCGRSTPTYSMDIINNGATFNTINTRIIGGNSLVLNSMNGSENFTYNTKGSTLFIESVALSPGMLSRILNGFRYSKAIRYADAILFGNFIVHGERPNTPFEEAQFAYLRQFFAKKINIPVLHSPHFGHGPTNLPLPLNTATTIERVSADKATVEIIANQQSTHVSERFFADVVI